MKNSKNNILLNTIFGVCFIAITFGYAQKASIQTANNNHKIVAGTCQNSSGEVIGYYGYCVAGNNSCIATPCPANQF